MSKRFAQASEKSVKLQTEMLVQKDNIIRQKDETIEEKDAEIEELNTKILRL